MNGKIKKEPKKPQIIKLCINVAKMGNCAFFCGKQQIPRYMANSRQDVKIGVPRNTAGPDHHQQQQ